MDLLVDREDLRRCRIVERAPAEPGAGQAVLSVDCFGLSSNNVTYAVMGDAMSYWEFFEAEDGWGRVPVWGFATVSASANPDLAEGTRFYGYLPMSTDLLVAPDRVDERGFVDATATPHLPARDLQLLQRGFHRPPLRPRPRSEQMLLRPLFGTSFLIDDFLAGEGLLEAGG